MTNLPAFALIATLALGRAYLAPPFQTTFITKDVSPEGMVLADPIYPPAFALWPENSVARAIKAGEALQCEVTQRVAPAVVNGLDSRVHVVELDCDGARFTVQAVQFEREHP